MDGPLCIVHMCMAGMAEGPKILGAQQYKLSISLSIYISGGEALEARPLPPPSFAGSYGYQRERKSKKSKSEKAKVIYLYI